MKDGDSTNPEFRSAKAPPGAADLRALREELVKLKRDLMEAALRRMGEDVKSKKDGGIRN